MSGTPNAVDASTGQNGDAPRRPLKLRTIAVALVLGSVGGVVVAIAVLTTLKRESLPPITMADVDAAAQRWAAKGPADYDMDVEQTGVNPGLIHVEVQNSNVTAMTLNGHPTRQHLWDDWSVPGLFSIIRRDVAVCMPDLNLKAQEKTKVDSHDPSASAPPVLPRGSFDPVDGHPTQYHRITPTGADATWRVTKFVPK